MTSNTALKRQIEAIEKRNKEEDERRMLQRKLRRLKSPGFARVADATGSLGSKLAKRLASNAKNVRKRGLGL